ncbi:MULTISPECIES: hypothetical protein [unclassified Frankia]|uniref:hypothetical protein n=1 Tax=unclassified Frankia TaxID=2632575 RepID=UPI002AD2AEB7|nr:MULTISPECIES: hypothetical protein [unclassified Frankia]
MRKLLQPGQRKLHWRDESDRRRHAIIEEVAGAPVEHLVVVYDGRQGEQSERRRKQCLKRLCYELDQMGVIRMVLESRGPADDHLDRVLTRGVDSAKPRALSSGRISRGSLPYPPRWDGVEFILYDTFGPTAGPTAGPSGVVGFDCSGLTVYAVYHGTGGTVVLPHNAAAQYQHGQPVW